MYQHAKLVQRITAFMQAWVCVNIKTHTLVKYHNMDLYQYPQCHMVSNTIPADISAVWPFSLAA